MKLTVVGDPHVTHKNLDIAHDLVTQVEAKGLDVIWLGDMLDTKEVIRGKCFNFWFNYFRSSKLNHKVLVGNHDYFNLECQEHSLEGLKALPNVVVVDDLLIVDELKAAFIPYVHDDANLVAMLDKIPHGMNLFGHLELAGFDFGNGYICEQGAVGKRYEKFPQVITGHFHKYQQQANITYLGTPYSLTFGESNQIKYLATYDTEGETSLTLTTTTFRQHVTVDYNLNESDCDWPIRKEDLVRINLIGTQEQIAAYDRSPWDEYQVKFVPKPTDQQSMDVEIDENTSNMAKFVQWGTDINPLEKETLDLGIAILRRLNA